MADEKLDEARTAEGTHAPTVEVDPTNELLDGDDKPLPQDLEDADVVIDESGTRLVHVDPDKQPGPDANLELQQLQRKHFQGIDPTDPAADEIRALREEHEGLTRRARYADDSTEAGRKVKSRLGQVADELKRLGVGVEPGKDEEADVDDSERAEQAEQAAQERAAAAKATGKDAPDAAPKGRTGRRTTKA